MVLSVLLSACALVAATVSVHAAGLSLILTGVRKWHAASPTRFWPITWVLIRVAWSLILMHLAEILVWGVFYSRRGCLPDAESAFYFAGVTYTTVG